MKNTINVLVSVEEPIQLNCICNGVLSHISLVPGDKCNIKLNPFCKLYFTDLNS